jgi:integrase
VKMDAGQRANGSRKQIVKTFDSLGAARTFVRQVRGDLIEGRYRAPDDMTLDELCARWLTLKDDVRPVTLEGYAAVLRPVRNRIGTRRVQSLTYDDMLMLKRWLAAEGGQRGGGLSERTVRMTFVCLGQVLDEGMRARLLTENVARLVKNRQKRNAVDPARWSAAQLLQFRSFTDQDRMAGVWRLVLCGLRRSEVMGLAWNRIDLDSGRVDVVQGRVALVATPGRRDHLDDPKSKQSWRSLEVETIHSGTVELLRDYHACTAGLSTSGLVVINAQGMPVHPEWFSSRFRTLCRAAEVPVIRLHAVRHSVADMLASLGVPPIDAAAMLGHTTSVYLDTYARSTPGGVSTAAARLGEAFERLCMPQELPPSVTGR